MTTITQNESKEQFIRELRNSLPIIAKHTSLWQNVVSSLHTAARSDVSFHNIEVTKEVLDDVKNATEALKKLHKALKSRAAARMKET